MDKKYILKGLLLVFLIPLTIYYFLTMPGSEVTISSFFILIFSVILIYDESIASGNKSINRNIYQLVIDRTLIVILIAISIDVLVSFFTKGISI